VRLAEQGLGAELDGTFTTAEVRATATAYGTIASFE
jgi:hypothetical protein